MYVENRYAEGVRKNAILLFSKPPIPGLVKTRLTPLKDGVLAPEAAAVLYHCMFFDVVQCCCEAIDDLEKRQPAGNILDGYPIDTYDIFISTTPPENLPVMKQIFADSGAWPRKIKFIADTGASFDEHFDDAFRQVFDEGYDTILSMGADMPALTKAVIIEGFEELFKIDDSNDQGMVVAPDQEMGVSLVGWTRRTAMDHAGVFYNAEGRTVLPAYITKAREKGLRVHYLSAVPDVDTMADLMHAITLVESIEYCAQFQNLSVPWRTIDALRQMGYGDIRVLPNELRDPREGIDVAPTNEQEKP